MTGIDAAVVQQPADHPYTVRLPHRRRSTPDPWDVDALAMAGIRLVHVHFGFEGVERDALGRWLDRTRAAGIAVVHTIHDLANPHLEDQRRFRELGDLLATRAEGVLTLSQRAAAAVQSRTGRRPIVVPHGPILSADDVRRHRGRRRHGVYVHAATCRPNLDVDLIEQLAAPARRLGGLRVHVRRPQSPRATAVLDRLRACPAIDVDVADRLDDGTLWARLAGAAVVVLPYRWGTHSGLLEAAHDLGTPVLAPDLGALVEQGAIRLDPWNVERSLEAAARSCPAVTPRLRRRQLRRSAEVHRALYHRLGAAA